MSDSYKCPHCGAKTATVYLPIISGIKAPISRDNVFERVGLSGRSRKNCVTFDDLVDIFPVEKTALTQCQACDRLIFWENGELRYPTPRGIDPADEMPENIKKDFIEAQSIINQSPRCTCVLLRVCLEKLTDYVAEARNVAGYNPDWPLFKKIDTLAKERGITADVKEMCDACRDTGNECAHKGKHELSDSDTKELAEVMSELINSLVDLWVKPAANIAKIRRIIPEKKK